MNRVPICMMKDKPCDVWIAARAYRLGLVTLLILPFLAYAQTADSPLGTANAPQSPQLAPVIVTAKHYDNGVGTSDAASQGVVNGQLYSDMPLLRPGEVLESVPGMVVTQHSGDGKANQYFLRGYNLDHGTDFAIRVDGVPVNLPTNAHGQGYSDLNFLIPEMVDTIDYRKGTYAAQNGDFSSAGSADIHYRNTLERNSLSVTAGRWGYLRTLWMTSSQASKDPSTGQSLVHDQPQWIGALETVAENGPWTTPEGMKKINAIWRLSDGSKSKGWSADFTAYTAHWNSTDQVPLDLIQSGKLGLYSALDPSDGGQSSRLGTSVQWHQNDGQAYTKINAWAQHYSMQLWSDFTFYAYRNPAVGCTLYAFSPCPQAPNADSPTDQFSQFESRNFLGTQVARGWSHALAGHESVTEVGLQIRHDDIHVGLLNTQNRLAFNTVSSDQVGQTSLGLYAQNVTYWRKWMKTVTGFREEHIDMHLVSGVIPENNGAASQSLPAPKFSLILGPWDKTEYFFNIGRGFHSNDARGVINRIDPTTLSSTSPVPALVPSFGKEVGIRTEAIQNLQTSLSLWHLHSDSEIVYNADSDIGSTSPNGASDRTGIEWNNHWTPGDWFMVDADGAWTRAHFTNMNDNGETGDRIPNAVGRVFILRATLHQGIWWSAGIETRYIGAYPLTQDGSMVAPSSTVTNLRYRRKINDRMEVSLDVLNLFNRRYDDIAYQQDEQTCANCAYNPNGETIHPGEPRQMRVTWRVFD